MEKQESIKIFEEKRIRTLWDEEQEKWYFSVVDVVQVLTGSVNPTDYLKKMRKRDPELYKGWGQIVTPLYTDTSGGRQKLNFADTRGILRIIQSIPSLKAEPFKLWMAQVASERLDQYQDPELSINQAMQDYKRLGYSDKWINQRLKSIEVRKELTDEWKRHGLQEGVHFATLTDVIYKSWSDMTAREYKKFKGLKKENLRDNMTNKELVLNMLAEISTKEISENSEPVTFDDHVDIASQGGEVARNARLELEAKTGKPVISALNSRSEYQNDELFIKESNNSKEERK
ncbi:MAG: Bro-N domain-containing protein [Bacteroidales bacterium]|nr:Bro-N domain-containing protein [Bacteroidales bacterium]